MFARSFNLQDMCLVVIVRDIDLFVYNKTIPQKYIDFLFRAYPDEVISKYKTLKKFIDEDCMLWFLNPHVRKVTLPAQIHSERVIQQLKVIGSGITSLNLHNSEASVNELNCAICCLTHVIDLDLSGTSCSDSTLICIKKFCSNLESLNVSFCEKITDHGMKSLCSGKLSLKNLNVLYSGIEGLGIATVLNGMPSLERIKCDDLIHVLYEIGKGKQYNLTELLYCHCDIVEDSMKVIRACIRMCPKLKKIHFEHPVNENVLKACVNFKHLEELKIKMSHAYYASVRVNDVLTPILPLSENLKTLILSCVEISPVTLIESFTSLENLYLKRVSFASFKKEDVKITRTNLTTLVINDMDMEVDDATYNAITLLITLSKNVTKLHLNHINNLPSEILNIVLQSMKNLTLISFDYTDVDMHSLQQLFEIPSLASVNANCCGNQEDFSANNLIAKRLACTLSWRDVGDMDEIDEYDNTNKYFYDDSDESDIVSDQCNSTDSEIDDRFWRYDFNASDDSDEYDYFDPYGWYEYGDLY